MSLQEPPTVPDPAGMSMGSALTMLPMAAGSGAMAMMFLQPGAKPVNYLSGGLMGVSSLGMVVAQLGRGGGASKKKLKAERRDYLRHLGQMRRQVRKKIGAQRSALIWRHPDPEGLWSVAMSSRRWERTTGDDDFAEIRIATGLQALSARVVPPQSRVVEDLEPLCVGALRRFVRAYNTVADVPMALHLRGFARVSLSGSPADVDGLVRSMLLQLAVFHSPDDVRIAVCAGGPARERWRWTRWLPHALHPQERDAAGQVRMMSDSLTEVERLLGGEDFRDRPGFEPGAQPSAREPFTVIVLDDVTVPADHRAIQYGYRNTVLIDVSGALGRVTDPATLRLRAGTAAGTADGAGAKPVRDSGQKQAAESAAGNGYQATDVGAPVLFTVVADRTGHDVQTAIGRPDTVSPARAEATAKVLAPYRTSAASVSGGPAEVDIELTGLLGIPDAAAHDPLAYWQRRSPRARLRVPIGVTEAGVPVELDIKESAQGGMGPHGMLIGATGSGKSELLRTIVLSMALAHSSETLNFVLVDFKGGATFLGLDELPHVSAVITNLADELPLVNRMRDALHGELVRRQELLRSAGNYSSVLDYERARAAGADLAPLPSLFLIVDEFSELLAANREFLELFVVIGRLGRSLGVHLLLAAQRLDEGRIHQVEGHLSYRIGLRTFSVAESRGVLGVGDAYELPASPGHGFLRFATDPLTRFRGAYVSAPYVPAELELAQEITEHYIVPYDTVYVAPRGPAAAPEPQDGQGEEPAPSAQPNQETLLTVLAHRMSGAGPEAHRIWLPPLGVAPTLDGLLPERCAAGALGHYDPTAVAELTVPVGIVDRPFEQRHDPLTADLSEAKGHVAVVGGPRSGKSALIRTLICALAACSSPANVQFYCLDFGGGTLASLAGLPHMGSVSGRLDADRVARTLAEMSGLIAARERVFAEAGIDSMATYRKRRANGDFPQDPFGDVFLVIDGWFTLHQDFEHLEPTVQEIAARGLSFGIHLVVGAARWTEVRPWLRDLLGTRFELRLGDPQESEINGRAAADVPTVAGRGLTEDRMHFLTALPRADGRPSAEDVGEGTRAFVEGIAAGWSGPAAPRVRMLPEMLPAAALPAPDGDLRFALGLDEALLEPVYHDFEQNPHLLVFGDTETGKTNTLRLVIQAIAARYRPKEARVLLADSRRDLFDAIPTAQQLSYAVTGAKLAELVAEIKPSLERRVPDADIDPVRLRQRDWWTGPRLFVVVDDYELMVGPTGSPLAGLLELLPQGVEIGLHLVIARSSAGGARGMTDPVLRRIWDLGASGVLLSTSRDEGTFLGEAVPRRLPPGRAQIVGRRHKPILVQTGFCAEPERELR
ncbi:type VII secretion protein EccCa [Catenulispora sp. NL8]|uniref:Type VII secretion protein EccCa n=1 Tax=Catenulispora pinistramenti TaxID=2705254 RepID=A0ABS5KJY5_9ACTN|nr:type VII secretion protein EccCa [Catenulispora pinistramenti]MBS2545726.1 type VII secretion protein EccCa [Catenulispora pinistramenti]